MQNRDGGYDSGYENSCPFWGLGPASLVLEASRLINFSGMYVLDAGCGEGKNAGFLANLGARVDAVDISTSALINAGKIWPKSDGVEWINEDVMQFEVSAEKYDVSIAYGLAHCLPDENAIESLVRKLLLGTRNGGLVIFCAFNARRQEIGEAHPGFSPALLSHSQYLNLFNDLDLLIETDLDLFEEHPHNKVKHVHSMTRLMGRRRAT